MGVKRILCSERVRRVPRQFSWIDQRLVRDGHMGRCSHQALALYLFLVTVSDAEGLSHYSDTKAGQLLNMDVPALRSARRELGQAGLIAYRRPLYQVLALDDPFAGQPAVSPVPPHRTTGEAISIGEVLRQAMGGVR